ncbi:MAG TPA: S49 family peptidase, partial [Euzebyales bacterium]|nr:S49 family peptidase [Euzebyales bacterium]
MSSAVRILGTATAAATAAAAASGVRIGDFGLGDALALARDARRGPVILTLDLTRPLRVPDASGVAALRMRGRPTLREVVEALEAAAGDDRVVALLGRVGDTSTGLATVQQLRAALRTFAAGGKPTVVHSEAFGGESGNSTLPYLLATAFDEVHLQPTGLVTLLGIASEVTFLRDALDKAGITPQFEHRHEYKNAADPLTERDFTPAHREALAAVVDSWAGQIVGDIAAARRLDADAVRAAMDSAPLVAREMLEHGLVDRLAYHDETLAGLRARVPGDAELLPLADYVAAGRARQRWRARRAPAVALLDARGPIYPGRRSSGPLSGPVITSDRLGAALRRAADDDDIAAVLLHVDSPGGVVGASDAIRRAVLTTRHAGTPVVAWMGEVAASGGYYISMAADRIVAQPGTLTGSIGVVLGKAVTSGLEERLGLQTRAVISSANARFFSRTSPWT